MGDMPQTLHVGRSRKCNLHRLVMPVPALPGETLELLRTDDEEAAARAYDRAVLERRGPDSRINFPVANYPQLVPPPPAAPPVGLAHPGMIPPEADEQYRPGLPNATPFLPTPAAVEAPPLPKKKKT